MKIKTTPMRTVTYFGADIKIPAHHIAVAADADGFVYSYDATPIEVTTCWRFSNSYDSVYKVLARVDFAETVEWRNSLQLYPLAEANKVTAADLKGEIENFPLHVVQAMCDEQVRQGNPFSPAVFQSHRKANLIHGGFNWFQSELGQETWDAIIFKRAFHRMPAAAHRHAGLMMKYAEIAQTTDKPWEHFELRRKKSAVWEAIYAPIPFYDNVEYRLKPEPPKTIRIGEYDVPEPVREPLEDDEEYWCVDLTAEEFAWMYKWNNAIFCNLMLRRGLIHLTKEAAVIHAKALLSLTKAAE